MKEYVSKEDAVRAATKWAVKSGGLASQKPIYTKIKEAIKKNLMELPAADVVERDPIAGAMNEPEGAKPEQAAPARKGSKRKKA